MPKTRVHRILDNTGTLAFAGVFDTLSAKLAQQVGLGAEGVGLILTFPQGIVQRRIEE